jgi:hypothetical protein
MSNRLGGIINVKVNGEIKLAKGEYSYNLGANKRDAIIGADRVHGYTEKPQAPFIEGEVTDTSDFDLAAFTSIDDATITLELANGKVIVLRNAWYAHEGTVKTVEGNIPLRFEGMSAEEVR